MTKVNCPHCSKSVAKYILKKHFKIYNEIRQGYVCDISGKTVFLENLNVHKKIT